MFSSLKYWSRSKLKFHQAVQLLFLECAISPPRQYKQHCYVSNMMHTLSSAFEARSFAEPLASPAASLALSLSSDPCKREITILKGPLSRQALKRHCTKGSSNHTMPWHALGKYWQMVAPPCPQPLRLLTWPGPRPHLWRPLPCRWPHQQPYWRPAYSRVVSHSLILGGQPWLFCILFRYLKEHEPFYKDFCGYTQHWVGPVNFPSHWMRSAGRSKHIILLYTLQVCRRPSFLQRAIIKKLTLAQTMKVRRTAGLMEVRMAGLKGAAAQGVLMDDLAMTDDIFIACEDCRMSLGGCSVSPNRNERRWRCDTVQLRAGSILVMKRLKWLSTSDWCRLPPRRMEHLFSFILPHF